MKIIYNEDEAIRRKAEIDREFELETKKARGRAKRDSLIIAIVSLLLTGFSGMGVWLLTSIMWATITIASIVFVLGAAVFIGSLFDIREATGPAREYPKDVVWYIMTHKHNVLKVEPKIESWSVGLVADLENRDGIVNTLDVLYLTKTFSTKITEETADLPNGKYLIPYTKED